MSQTPPKLKLLAVALSSLIVFNCASLHMGESLVLKHVESEPLLKKATLAYHAGNFNEAGKYYEKVLSHNQDDAITAYNLACCYALQGDASKAALYVSYAFNNGFQQLDIFLEDTDFDPVRDDPEFQKAVQKINERFKSIENRDYVILFPWQADGNRFSRNDCPPAWNPAPMSRQDTEV
jgi:tetratricopeptide (TPR) repeat protein